MPKTAQKVLGVVAVSSPDYVRTMLEALQAGHVTVPLHDPDNQELKERSGVQEIVSPTRGSGWLDDPFTPVVDDKLAMISFTSGTEGLPKAVHLSAYALADVVDRLNAVMTVTDEICEYVGVPVYHSFGYGRCRAVLTAGGRCFIPEKFDLNEIRRMLLAEEINAISAVPSLWRVFLSGLDMFGPELEKVRWVEIGSQYMSVDEKIALKAALPNAIIVQHYGLTEASRTTFLRIDKAATDTLESVGRADGQVQIRISADGLIEIHGPHVAMGVDDGTGLADVGTDGWLTTSDQGHLTTDGFLYFEGRADDVINCGGVKLVPDLIEAALRAQVPQASDFGVLRCDDAMRGDGVMLALTPDAEPYRNALVNGLDEYLSNQGLSARSAIVVKAVPKLPRTATGKLQRKILAQDLATDAEPNGTAPAGFKELLTTIFGANAADSTQSFMDLGGDSLAHMQLQLVLERAMGIPPVGWETYPLVDLADKVAAKGDFAALMKAPGGAPPLPDGSKNLNPDMPFRALIAEDYRTNDASIFHQGFLMLLIHRFGNWRMGIKSRLLRAPLTMIYRFLNKLTQLFFGIKLDYTVKVGRRVKLEHFGGMILGAREIGNDVVLRQNTTLGIRSTADPNAKPVIGDFVDVGAGAVIVGNIQIGENAIISANSVVFTSVPEDAVMIGVPARMIGTNPRKNPSPLGWK